MTSTSLSLGISNMIRHEKFVLTVSKLKNFSYLEFLCTLGLPKKLDQLWLEKEKLNNLRMGY